MQLNSFFLNESTKKTALSSRNEEAGDAEGEKISQ